MGIESVRCRHHIAAVALMLCDDSGELDHELVDCVLNRLELALELAVFGGGHARGNDGTRDVAGASQGGF